MVQGLAQEANGSFVIKVAVTAAPEGGKANAAVIKLLAKAWKVPKSAVTVVAGLTDRRKVLHVDGPSDALLPRLKRWVADLPGAE